MNKGDWVRVRRPPVLSGDRAGASQGDVGVVRDFIGTSALYIDFTNFNPKRDASVGRRGYTHALQLGDVEVIEAPNIDKVSEGREW